MRALVVHPGPAFSVQDVYSGWVWGLKQNGVEVATFNLGDRLDFYDKARIKRGRRYTRAFGDEPSIVRMAAIGLKAACYDWWPDLLLIVSAFYVPPDFYSIFRARKHKVVILHTESPYEDGKQLVRAQHADLNVLNDPTNIEAFDRVAPSIYIPHAYHPERHHPRPPDPECESDFCFVGTGFPSRIGFFEQVDWSGVDATFAGNWQQLEDSSPLAPLLAHPKGECCPNEETVKLYTSTKVSANLYRREAEHPELEQGWAMGPREVELAATGTFFLRDPRGEGDEVFPMLPTFTEPGEFGELVRWWCAHNDERIETASKARAAIADRTFANHAAQLLRELD